MATTYDRITRLSCAETAKLVRQALKEAFPTIVFRVRSKVYSGGASINVDWQDGPTARQVEAVAQRFEGAEFDGMVDLKSYREHEVDGQRVHFGADFIFCQRTYSRALLDRVIEHAYCTHAELAAAPWPEVQESHGDAYIAWVPEIKIGPDYLNHWLMRQAYDTGEVEPLPSTTARRPTLTRTF